MIEDKSLRQQIFELGMKQLFLLQASGLILFTGDVKAWIKDTAYLWLDTPEEVCNFMVSVIGPFHEKQEQLQRDEAMRSVGIAMQTMMLAAQDIGYDTSPAIGFDHAAVAKLFGLPNVHIIQTFVAVGKRTQEPRPKPKPLPVDKVLLYDHFAD